MSQANRDRLIVYVALTLCALLTWGIVYQRGVIETQRALIRGLWTDVIKCQRH